MKKLVIAALILSAGTSLFAQKKVKSPIEGRIYTVTLKAQNEKKAEPVNDEISFITGPKFKSGFMFQAGFQQCEYEYEVTDTTAGAMVVKFTVEGKNDDTQERFTWDCTLEGEKVTGTAEIRKKGKVQHTYDVSGYWKNKKKVKPAPKPVAVPITPPDSTKTGG